MVAQAITTARAAGVSGLITVRGDSAYGNRAVIRVCRRYGAVFSLVLTRNSAVQRAIDAGSLRADLDATRGAIFVWMGMHGITSLLISLSAFPWGDHDELIREMCELQLRSLAAS